MMMVVVVMMVVMMVMVMVMVMVIVMVVVMVMVMVMVMVTFMVQESGQAMDSIMFSNRGGKVTSPTGFYWSGWTTDGGYAAACRWVIWC